MKKPYLFLFGLLSLHLIVLLNIQFTAWPEVFSFPYLLNNGFSIFGGMVHPYPPLLSIALSILYTVFGYNLTVLQVCTWALILIADILVFIIVKKITNSQRAALLSTLFYVLLQPVLEGNMLWYDTALVVPLLLGSYFLLFENKKYLIFSGMSFGIASLIKQTGGMFVILVFIYLLVTKWKKKSSFLFLLPVVIFWLVFSIQLTVNSEFQWFFNWVIGYPSEFWTEFPGYVQMSLSSKQLAVLFATFLPSIFLFRKRNKQTILFALLFIVALVAVYPRFSFFHYQPALAFAAILTGISLNRFQKKQLLFFAYFVLLTVFSFQMVKRNWQMPVRFFSETEIHIAEQIKIKTSYSDRIYFLGVPSQYYLLTDSLPPKPWLDNYGWYFEVPHIADMTINAWEKYPPEFVVWQKPNAGAWYEIGVYNSQKVIEWIKQNYDKVDTIDGDISIYKRI